MSGYRKGVLRRRLISRIAMIAATVLNAFIIVVILITEQRVAWLNLAALSFLAVVWWFVDRAHTEALEATTQRGTHDHRPR